MEGTPETKEFTASEREFANAPGRYTELLDQITKLEKEIEEMGKHETVDPQKLRDAIRNLERKHQFRDDFERLFGVPDDDDSTIYE